MKAPEFPSDESDRLEALYGLDLLDTPAEQRFDAVTRTARRLFDVPMALITLVDAERQWFKSRCGLDAEETAREVSFCGHAILDDSALVVPDALDDERFSDNPLVLGEPNIRFYAGHPLRTVGGARVGTLCLLDRRPRTFNDSDRDALSDLALLVEGEFAAIELASIDELTGLLNRRGFTTQADRSLSLCGRKGWRAALMFLDCDDFKTINDSFGHAEGDLALKAMAQNIQSSCRTEDVIGRIGGDEFVVLLLDSNSDQAEQTANRMHDGLETLRTDEGARFNLDFSYGIVEFDPENPTSIGEMLEQADALMYRAKRAVEQG